MTRVGYCKSDQKIADWDSSKLLMLGVCQSGLVLTPVTVLKCTAEAMLDGVLTGFWRRLNARLGGTTVCPPKLPALEFA